MLSKYLQTALYPVYCSSRPKRFEIQRVYLPIAVLVSVRKFIQVVSSAVVSTCSIILVDFLLLLLFFFLCVSLICSLFRICFQIKSSLCEF